VTEAKIEVVVRDEMVEGAIRIIREKAKTDEPEDRDIRVFSLEDIAGQARGKTGAVAS
jgi:nitrogen regulatory protein PII